MAVRFFPSPGERGPAAAPERENLAEVIELRSRLRGSRAPRGGEAPKPDADPPGPGADLPGPGAEPLVLGDEAPASPAGAEASAAERERALEDGRRLLGRRARSREELRRELERLGHRAEHAEAAVSDFVDRGSVDDADLAERITELQRERKGASRAQVRRALSERLISSADIDAALAQLSDEEDGELLVTAARDRARKLSGLDPRTAERRLLGFLARRGWSGEAAVRAARAALDHPSRDSH